MGKYSLAGIVVALACSFLAFLVAACAQTRSVPAKDETSRKLLVVAGCARALSDSFRSQPPEIVVYIYDDTSTRRRISVPNWFLTEVGRKNVHIGRGKIGETGPGISILAVYLNRVELATDGTRNISINEVHSLSDKYLHEFSVLFSDGNPERVWLAGSTRL